MEEVKYQDFIRIGVGYANGKVYTRINYIEEIPHRMPTIFTGEGATLADSLRDITSKLPATYEGNKKIYERDIRS